MKSPFLGMDPFIEAHGHLWEDFRFHLVVGIANHIKTALPANYFGLLRRREYVALDYSNDTPRATGTRPTIPPDDSPREVRAFRCQEHREPYFEVYELGDERRLVTRVEVLSPANKEPETTGWTSYLEERRRLLVGEANLVEIDLLRCGTRMPMLDEWPRSPYALLVARSERAPYCKVWPAHFDRPLPALPFPLDEPDQDLTLDLQPLIEDIYTVSRYHLRINYSKPLVPALSDEQTAWLAQRLSQRGGS